MPINKQQSSPHTLEEIFRMIETFFSQAPALFCVLKGPDHIFDYSNSKFSNLANLESLKGKRFSEVFGSPENTGHKMILDRVYQTGRPHFARGMKTIYFPGNKSNESEYCDLGCQPLYNTENEIEGLFFFLYEGKDQPNDLRNSKRNIIDLEVIIGERSRELEQSNMTLALSNKNLQEFASIASHDLQEPLRKIRTFISILKDKHAKELSAEARELMDKTQLAASRMSTLIKDVLNYSRVVVPENSFVRTDLNLILKNVLLDFDLLIEEKKAIVNVKPGIPFIEAITLQMNQLFFNIIGNALKFTGKKKEPVIDIDWDHVDPAQINKNHLPLRQDKSYIQLIIKDNGIGFSQQFAEQVFSIFERLNTSADYEGTGIGLALCRKIVDNHKGMIWAKSQEETGTSIYIILPTKQ